MNYPALVRTDVKEQGLIKECCPIIIINARYDLECRKPVSKHNRKTINLVTNIPRHDW